MTHGRAGSMRPETSLQAGPVIRAVPVRENARMEAAMREAHEERECMRQQVASVLSVVEGIYGLLRDLTAEQKVQRADLDALRVREHALDAAAEAMVGAARCGGQMPRRRATDRADLRLVYSAG